ncbi:MAG TPA: DUF2950 domain-containing protein [Candidatus Udaeobacter sp.]|nr:DUF2950 domain-containing protein [Candidatus Udaeobacter sp.]
MKIKWAFNYWSKFLAIAFVVVTAGSVGFPLHAGSEKKSDTAANSDSKKEREFSSAKQAADTLIRAAEVFDVAALKEILGPDAANLISSADPVADKKRAVDFAAKAKEKTSLNVDPKNSKCTILSVGNDDFPLAIPIVQRKGKWMFDTKAGRNEILMRRIGANELDAIEICRGFVEAQHEYAQEKHDGSPVNQYAQKIISSEDKHDGLAWKNADGSWGGPVGENVGKAIAEGYSDKTAPYHGYFFKVLKRQGPAAPLGQLEFVVNGVMIGGFALVAAPAQYRVTGVQTFIVGSNGIVYQKDLGPNTLKTFASLDRFNPDKSWHPTDDKWPAEEASAK